MAHSSVPVLSVWYYLIFGLLFFTLDAHLALVQLMLESYRAHPIGMPFSDLPAFLAVVPGFFPAVLRAAVLLSLPVTVAMLAVNMVVGVLSRAAPQFNPIQVGMPIAAAARRSHGDENRLGASDAFGQVGGERQATRLHIGLDQRRQAGLVDRHDSFTQAVDLRPVLVDADDLVPEIGEARARNQADVARPHHCNLH